MFILIQAVPKILEFVIPGFLFFRVISFFAPMEAVKTPAYTVVWFYVVVSVLFKGLGDLCHLFILPDYTIEPYVRVLILCAMAVVVALIIAKIWKSKLLNFLVNVVGHKDMRTDIFNGLLDYEDGVMLSALMKDGSVYIGSLFLIEEHGNESWISLTDYSAINPDGVSVDADEDKHESLLLFRRSDIQRVRFVYPDSHAVAKEIRKCRKSFSAHPEEKSTANYG